MTTTNQNSPELDLSQIENLAITGANGFVGKSIVDLISSLRESNLPKSLTLITRGGVNFKLAENLNKKSKEINQDLTDPWEFPNQISHLINLAADGTKDPYSIESCRNFEKISRNLVGWARKSQRNLRILHASSGACFGHKPLDEGKLQDLKKESFAQNRLSVEEYLVENSNDLNFELSIARLFSFSGINILSKPQYAISNFITSAIKLGQINISGDPFTQRSYLHQSDMSEWILRALITPNPHLNLQIGSSNSVTIGELAEFIAQKTGAAIEYPDNALSGDIYIPQNEVTRIKLGVEERIGWQDAVIEMIAEARKLTNDAK